MKSLLVNVSPKTTRIVQNLAFSYGYKWINQKSGIQYENQKGLDFDPNGKVIYLKSYTGYYADKTSRYVEYDVNSSTTLFENFDKVVEWFQNPSILDEDQPTMTTTKLPLAVFTYPKSDGSGDKKRKVRVCGLSSRSLSGTEETDGNKFKEFLISRVVGSISFSV